MNDRPPPSKEAEEFLEEELRSARTGIAIMLVCSGALIRNLHFFSRKPGTAGPVAALFSIFSVVVFVLFYEEMVKRSGSVDAIPPASLCLAFVAAWCIGVVRTLLRSRTDSVIGLGQGVLRSFIPHRSELAVGLISDLAIASALIALFSMFKSPIQAKWFVLMALGSIVWHGFFLFRAYMKHARINAAASRSSHWSPSRKNW